MGEPDLPASPRLVIRALERFSEAGITESTMKVYRAGWSRYQTFANQFEIASTPVTLEKVTLPIYLRRGFSTLVPSTSLSLVMMMRVMPWEVKREVFRSRTDRYISMLNYANTKRVKYRATLACIRT